MSCDKLQATNYKPQTTSYKRGDAGKRLAACSLELEAALSYIFG
jgi:hypothetical protein